MMEEGQRKQVYVSLLRGLAREAQDRLCAADSQHDWSPWHRTALKHDIPPQRPRGPDHLGDARDEVFRIKSERFCRNCGKRQTV